MPVNMLIKGRSMCTADAWQSGKFWGLQVGLVCLVMAFCAPLQPNMEREQEESQSQRTLHIANCPLKPGAIALLEHLHL